MNKTDYTSQKLVVIVNVLVVLMISIDLNKKVLSCGFHAFSILEEYDFRLNVKCFITVEGNLELREKCT